MRKAWGFIGITWSHKTDTSDRFGKFYHYSHLLVNDLIMEIKYDSKKRRKGTERELAHVVTFHLHSPLFFIIQMTANRIS